ncbi:MAG: hypothetical protein WBX27_07765 [Specibacter sp.]
MTNNSAQLSEDAYLAIRTICHQRAEAYPAPHAYETLANLKMLAAALGTSIEIIGQGLTNSLETHNVTDAPGTNPATGVTIANHHLAQATSLARQLADLLDSAQQAITNQGYKD